jgi:cytochrome P450
MDHSQNYEVGRLTFRSERLSPASELLRWSCEQRKIAYIELPSGVPDRTQILPQVFTPNGVTSGIEAALDLLDRRCRSGERIFGETQQVREANRQLLADLQSSLARPAQQLWYFHALDHPDFFRQIVKSDASWWQAMMGSINPGWLKQRFRRRYDLDRFDPEAAESRISASLTKIETDLQTSGTPSLSGNDAGPADVIFAALVSPLVCPPNFGAPYPVSDLAAWPAPLRELVEKVRARPAGQLVLRVYEQARPTPQPPLPAPSYGPSFFESLFSPAIVRRVTPLLVRFAPRLTIANRLIVSSWQDVTDVLSRDNEFLIAPINEARINSVGGPFMLGMDRSPALIEQREHVYAALRDANKQPLLEILKSESSRLLQDAIEGGGQIEVVNGYARLVAGRTAAALFGISGPTEQDYLRVIRSIFHETFLNQSGDAAVRERGVAAGQEIKSWIQAEIQRRLESQNLGDDVLGRLLQSTGQDQDASRLMMGGCLVGAIDTTATVVANIVEEVIVDPKLKVAMTQDMDHPQRLLGWCWEALRRRPHNLGMLRQAGQHATLRGEPVKEGTQVVLLTVAAMHDPAAFENPNELVPDRPLDRYLHFGRGLHHCAGRDFNVIQIPHLVRELLRCDVSGWSNMRTRGPFPDELIVSVRAPR